MSSSLYSLCLFFIVLFSFSAYVGKSNRAFMNFKQQEHFATISLMLFCVIGMASLPVPWNTGADREFYAYNFLNLLLLEEKDILFTQYCKIFGNILSVKQMFYLTAFIYVGNFYLAIRKMVPNNTYMLLLLFVTSFLFYAYGTNTMRAGLAASFIILAIAYSDNLKIMCVLLLIGVNIHFSMIIPTIAIVVTNFYVNVRLFFYLWLLAVGLSLLLGSYFEYLFMSMGLMDGYSGYFGIKQADTHYKVGFRWDFLLYGSLPIIAGLYYIYYRHVKSLFYQRIFSIYILANMFWVLVIRSAFSDRIAYLSWFIYPLILTYPLFKERLSSKNSMMIAFILLGMEMLVYFIL